MMLFIAFRWMEKTLYLLMGEKPSQGPIIYRRKIKLRVSKQTMLILQPYMAMKATQL